MISRRKILAAGLAVTAGCRRERGDGFNGYAFVANQEGRAIAAVDLTAFAVAKHIALDDAPTALSAPNAKPSAYALTPATGTLYEIDCAKLAIRRKLKLGAPATTMCAEPGGACIWVLSGPAKRLYRVTLESLQVTATVRLPLEPASFDLRSAFHNSRWEGLGAVSYGAAGSVSLVDLNSGHVSAPRHVGGELGPVSFLSNGSAVLAANLEARQLVVIDSAKNEIVVKLPLSVRPDHFCFHPNGGQLFISGEGRDAVVVVYPYYVPEVAETVLAGNRPGPMAATSTHLFVTNPAAGDVTILNITRRRMIAVTTVGSGPGSVTVTPDGEYALVLNQISGDMAVIRIAGLRPDRYRTASLFTMIPVGSKPVSAVVKAV